jgi:hypothetical protein
MSKDETAALQTAATDESTDIEPRTRRAVTECMTVLPADGDTYTVVGEHGGGEYEVKAHTGECSCPDSEYNLPAHKRCKHARRVAIVLGGRPMPAVDPDDVDPHLGEHVDTRTPTPTPDAAPGRAIADGGEIIEAGDDGEILDEEDDVACVEGEAWCPGPEADLDDETGPLPCFECYLAAKRREPAEWILAAREDTDHEEPARSEPADFGHGESTGVQEL